MFRPLLASLVAITALAASPAVQSAFGESPPFNPIGEQETLVIPVRMPVPGSWDGKECANAKDPADIAKWKAAAARYGATPRYPATQFAKRLNVSTDLNFFYSHNSYGKTVFDFVALSNPGSSDGWWTAPQTQAKYCTAAVNSFGAPGNFMYDVMKRFFQGAIDRGASATKPKSTQDCLDSNLGATTTCGIITRAQAERFHRVLVVLDIAGRGGQTAPRVAYNIAPGGSGTPSESREFSAAYVDQDANEESFYNVARHELGHTLRLSAHYYTGCPQFKPADIECLGPWDPMGWDWARTEFGGFSRVEAGWIPDVPDYVVNLPQMVVPGDKPDAVFTVPLAPIEAPFTTKAVPVGKPLVARIPVGSTVPFKGLVLECRQRLGFDAQTPSAVTPTSLRGLPSQGGILVSYVDITRDNPRIYVERPNELKALSLATLSPGGAFVLDAYARHLEIKNTGDGSRCVASVSLSYSGTYTGYNVGFRPGEAGSSAFKLPPDASSRDIWIDSAKNGFGDFDPKQEISQVGHVKVPEGGGDAPSPGHLNRVWFRLHNEGDTTARRLRVQVMASPSPLGRSCAKALRTIGTVHIGSIRPGRDAIRSIRWTPRAAEDRGQVVVRVKGEGADVDRTDDFAQRTFDPLGNRSRGTRRILLPGAFGCRNPAGLTILPRSAPGWRISIGPRIRSRTRSVLLNVSRSRGARRRPSGLTFIATRVDAQDYPAPADQPAIPLADLHQETIGVALLARPYVQPSSVQLACDRSGRSGAPFQVRGRVKGASEGAPVEVDYESPTGIHRPQQRTTLSRGRLSDAFVPDEAGLWTVRARWFGDGQHMSAASPRCAVQVEAAQTFPRPPEP